MPALEVVKGFGCSRGLGLVLAVRLSVLGECHAAAVSNRTTALVPLSTQRSGETQ